ncbi:MAG: RNA polymerase factor sigma-54 [Treponema sp.]|nr:RNA polymerase factor sigma-54 [Treponema sp.]
MSGIGFGLSQSQKMAQAQVMSQRQIMSMNFLAMGTEDLKEKIYDEVAKNPALEISDNSFDGEFNYNERSKSTIHEIKKVSASAVQASDDFQKALESSPDTKESLQHHLIHQINMLKLKNDEKELCEDLVYNLDSKGYHILAPESIAKGKESIFDKCLHLVQNLEPVGCAVKNVWESLIVQTESFFSDYSAYKTDSANKELVIFLLSNNSFMENPQSHRILKKIEAFVKERKSQFALSEKELAIIDMCSNVTEDDLDKAIAFIKTLNPFPASDYGSSNSYEISPDVFIDEVIDVNAIEGEPKILYKINLSNANLPEVSISKSFMDNHKQLGKDGEKLILDAKNFINDLSFRASTLENASKILLDVQHSFFEKGPGYIVPFRQRDMAEILKVHESTVSRLANEKFLKCKWGTFPFKYFFSNSVKGGDYENASPVDSKDFIKNEISKILENHKNDKKKLSDQKISDMLKNLGITIARRTVAKYRVELNIDSSYAR